MTACLTKEELVLCEEFAKGPLDGFTDGLFNEDIDSGRGSGSGASELECSENGNDEKFSEVKKRDEDVRKERVKKSNLY